MLNQKKIIDYNLGDSTSLFLLLTKLEKKTIDKLKGTFRQIGEDYKEFRRRYKSH